MSIEISEHGGSFGGGKPSKIAFDELVNGIPQYEVYSDEEYIAGWELTQKWFFVVNDELFIYRSNQIHVFDLHDPTTTVKRTFNLPSPSPYVIDPAKEMHMLLDESGFVLYTTSYCPVCYNLDGTLRWVGTPVVGSMVMQKLAVNPHSGEIFYQRYTSVQRYNPTTGQLLNTYTLPTYWNGEFFRFFPDTNYFGWDTFTGSNPNYQKYLYTINVNTGVRKDIELITTNWTGLYYSLSYQDILPSNGHYYWQSGSPYRFFVFDFSGPIDSLGSTITSIATINLPGISLGLVPFYKDYVMGTFNDVPGKVRIYEEDLITLVSEFSIAKASYSVNLNSLGHTTAITDNGNTIVTFGTGTGSTYHIVILSAFYKLK